MNRISIAALTSALILSGCSYPVEQLKQTEERPSILIEGAPYDAILIVDGLVAGPANGSDGQPQAIRIEPGMHQIQVMSYNRLLTSERVFVSGSGVKTIHVSQ